MGTKIQFFSSNVSNITEFINNNECLEEFNKKINKWLSENPCEVLDIKYNEVVSYIEDEADKTYKYYYTDYISAMVIYKELI